MNIESNTSESYKSIKQIKFKVLKQNHTRASLLFDEHMNENQNPEKLNSFRSNEEVVSLFNSEFEKQQGQK